MIKGNFVVLPVGDEFHSCGIRSRLHLRRICFTKKGHGYGMSARVASRIGIYADKTKVSRMQPGFFFGLPNARLFDRLANLHKPARQSIGALERIISPPNKNG